jgi:hypothetical protein
LGLGGGDSGRRVGNAVVNMDADKAANGGAQTNEFLRREPHKDAGGSCERDDAACTCIRTAYYPTVVELALEGGRGRA